MMSNIAQNAAADGNLKQVRGRGSFKELVNYCTRSENSILVSLT
jgi:hypothetical protein